jgi:hypothetical protein
VFFIAERDPYSEPESQQKSIDKLGEHIPSRSTG